MATITIKNILQVVEEQRGLLNDLLQSLEGVQVDMSEMMHSFDERQELELEYQYRKLGEIIRDIYNLLEVTN